MKKYGWVKIILLTSFVLVFAACSQVDNASSAYEPQSTLTISQPVSGTQTEPEKEGNPMDQPTPAPGMEFLIEKAKEDLAQHLSIATTEIDLVEASAVTWPDASLGCPQPGMSYIQVPQDGGRIVLQVQGINYEYHNGGSRGLFLCEKAKKDSTPPPQIDITDLTPQLKDKSDSSPVIPDNGIPPGEDQ